MQQAEFERHVGKENIVPSINDAIRRSNELYTSQYASDSRWQS
jgi:hypothetical protein